MATSAMDGCATVLDAQQSLEHRWSRLTPMTEAKPSKDVNGRALCSEQETTVKKNETQNTEWVTRPSDEDACTAIDDRVKTAEGLREVRTDLLL